MRLRVPQFGLLRNSMKFNFVTTRPTWFRLNWICGQSKPYLGLGFDFICSIVSSWFVKSSNSYWSFAKSFCTSSLDNVLGPKSGPSPWGPSGPFGPYPFEPRPGSSEPKWGPIEPCRWPSYSLKQGFPHVAFSQSAGGFRFDFRRMRTLPIALWFLNLMIVILFEGWILERMSVWI